jgi:tripeptidyl-peptidase-1
MVAPKDESKDLVFQWLESAGLSSNAALSRDSVVVKATIADVEKLLKTEYVGYGKSLI